MIILAVQLDVYIRIHNAVRIHDITRQISLHDSGDRISVFTEEIPIAISFLMPFILQIGPIIVAIPGSCRIFYKLAGE